MVRYNSRAIMVVLTTFLAATRIPSSQAFVQSAIRSTSTRAFHFTSLASTAEASPEAKPAEQPKKVKIDRVLSGVQPTGSIHLGNYLGAIRQWVDFQDTERKDDEGNVIPTENYFCVVDLHAITMPHDPQELYEASKSVAALYVAAGKLNINQCTNGLESAS